MGQTIFDLMTALEEKLRDHRSYDTSSNSNSYTASRANKPVKLRPIKTMESTFLFVPE